MLLAFVYSAVSFAFRPVVYATFTYTVHVDLKRNRTTSRKYCYEVGAFSENVPP